MCIGGLVRIDCLIHADCQVLLPCRAGNKKMHRCHETMHFVWAAI